MPSSRLREACLGRLTPAVPGGGEEPSCWEELADSWGRFGRFSSGFLFQFFVIPK